MTDEIKPEAYDGPPGSHLVTTNDPAVPIEYAYDDMGGRPSAALANQWVMERFIERLPQRITSRERTVVELVQAMHHYEDELVLDIRRGLGLAARNTVRILRIYVDELDRRIEEGVK